MPNKSMISVNAKVEFLGTDFVGVFETGSTDSDEAGKKVTTKETRVLVLPTDTEHDGIKLTKIVSDVNDLIKAFSTDPNPAPSLSEEDVKKKMQSFGLSVFDDITINLRQVFLYQDTTVKTDGQTKLDEKKNMEYAINIEITNVLDLPKEFKLFNIQSIGLAIWNTDRKKVLDRMSIASIDDLLKS
jgi:hypothetical protein